ncbi:hypothetical protein OQA88_13594 [Cercophora sp. LCS_1]
MLQLARGGRRQLTSAFICSACRSHPPTPRRFTTSRINGAKGNAADANTAASAEGTVPPDPPAVKNGRMKAIEEAEPEADNTGPNPRRVLSRLEKKETEAGPTAAEELADDMRPKARRVLSRPEKGGIDAGPSKEEVAPSAQQYEEPKTRRRRGRPSGHDAQAEPEEGEASETAYDEYTNEVRASDCFPRKVWLKRRLIPPRLQYGLDRVLFNPGPYLLQDSRSRVYNFDPYLARIMPAEEFDFQALRKYVTSSKDETLIAMSREHGCKYTGSTSSMTSVLAHFHYLLSAWRPINTTTLSKSFTTFSHNFTLVNRAPAATFLHYKDGVYAIDADKQFDSGTILSMLGKSMEKLLTVPKEKFELYRKRNSDALPDEERNAPESFNYTILGDFMMRSQLDAYDPMVPNGGLFDLKTRAVVTIRMDARNPKKGDSYEIIRRHGNWQSYEREYFDMMRSAFLKYSLQVRMGRMDGIFVAFHNTKRIFGFQYIPLEEMDLALHGTSHLALGASEFRLSVHLLNKVLDRATKRFPEQTLRLFFETKSTTKVPSMYIFAKPVTPEEVAAVQDAAEARAEEFERKMSGSYQADAPTETVESSVTEGKPQQSLEEESAEIAIKIWENLLDHVGRILDEKDQGAMSTRDVIEMALRETGLLGTDETTEAEHYINSVVDAFSLTNEPAVSESSVAETPYEPSMLELFGRLTVERVIQDEPSTQFIKFQEVVKGMIMDSRNMVIEEGAEEGIEEGIEDADMQTATPESFKESLKPAEEGVEQYEAEDLEGEDVFGMVLTVQNEVRGEPVVRPDRVEHSSDWTVKYKIKELSPAMARRAFQVVVRRRRRIFEGAGTGGARSSFYGKMLRKYSKLGHIRRRAEEARSRRRPVRVYGWEKSLKYSDVFGSERQKGFNGRRTGRYSEPSRAPEYRKGRADRFSESMPASRERKYDSSKPPRRAPRPHSSTVFRSLYSDSVMEDSVLPEIVKEREEMSSKDEAKASEEPKPCSAREDGALAGTPNASEAVSLKDDAKVALTNTLKTSDEPKPPSASELGTALAKLRALKQQLAQVEEILARGQTNSAGREPASDKVEKAQEVKEATKDKEADNEKKAQRPNWGAKTPEGKEDESWFEKDEKKPKDGGWWPF